MASSTDLALAPNLRSTFELAKTAAVRVLERRTRVVRVVQRSLRKVVRNEASLARARGDIRTLARLAYAWTHGHYRAIPWRSVLYAAAALVYFLNPIDLIPDALLGIGFVDDMAVVAAVVQAIRSDLDSFHAWENDRGEIVVPSVERAALPSGSQPEAAPGA